MSKISNIVPALQRINTLCLFKFAGNERILVIFMREHTPATSFIYTMCYAPPDAAAWVTGGSTYPNLSGMVKFYLSPYRGILVEAEFFGLPNISAAGSSDFYAMHIHENGDCTPPFDKTGNHYNPTGMPHPQHAGDLIPIMGNQGYAWTVFYNKRITVPEIIGKSVIIHRMPDDFTSQPAGNSGEKIACGVIR